MRLFKWIKQLSSPSDKKLSEEYIHYAKYAYPSNHTYKISHKKLFPKRKLNQRYKKLRKLFPTPLTSLADIGCSKGFFVFAAANHFSTCMRSIGIDITQYDIDFCQHIKSYLNDQKTRFEILKLHEFASRIDEFGGPFQTVLLLNIYQYLYFGSDRFDHHYLDHDLIFKNLREICNQRIIFCNRVNWIDCQNERWLEQAKEKRFEYSETSILQAATQYFNVTKHGFIGRYPLWTLDCG